MPTPLTVRVNNDLMLDAGACEEVPGPEGLELLIRSPRTTLFHQVLSYLRDKPGRTTKPSGSTSDREGAASCAMTLRWALRIGRNVVDHAISVGIHESSRQIRLLKRASPTLS